MVEQPNINIYIYTYIYTVYVYIYILYRERESLIHVILGDAQTLMEGLKDCFLDARILDLWKDQILNSARSRDLPMKFGGWFT